VAVMSIVTLLNEAKSKLVWIILPLSIAALFAEMLPEVKAKILVIPTLILIIILCALAVQQRWSIKRKLI
jgi:hypothetical protein